MRNHFTTGLIVVMISLFMFTGCDVSVNPLVFDGTPISARLEVDTEETSFEYSQTVDLNWALEGTDDMVDSISVFNVTLSFENVESPSSDTPFTGNIFVDDVNLINVTGLTIGDFGNERSLFASDIQESVTINAEGMELLAGKLKQTPLPAIDVKVSGETEQGPLRFDVRVSLYTQVYTSP